MATVLGLAVKISADATGIQKNLSPVERAFKQLDAEVAKVTDVFKTFSGATAGASRAQQQFATDLAFLQSALRTGKIDGEQFAAEFAKIAEEASKTAESFREGARLTEENRTQEEKRAAELARLNELLQLGAINQETFNKAAMEASGANDAAKAAAKEQADADQLRSDSAKRAAEIVEANLTKEQKAVRDFQVAQRELNSLKNKGLLTESEYAAALERVTKEYDKARAAAEKFAKEQAKAGDAGTLKFNELSGILSALPGPIGNVAGRLSGLSSAGEGLARVFSGGLSSGLSSIGTQFTGLLTSTNIAVAAVAGFGAAASAVATGLSQLSGRVEELSFAARQAGVDFQSIQVLDEAATRAGVSVEALALGVQRFGARLADAAKGSGETYNALQQLGFSLQEIQQGQNDPSAFAGRVAAALEKIPEPAKQAQLQIDVLGRGGENLVRAFGELEVSTLAIRRFGGAISELDRDRLLDLDTAFENVQRSILGFGRELLTPFIGVARSVADSLAPVIASLGRVFGNVLDFVSPLTSTLGLLINVVGQTAAVIANLIGVGLEPFAAAGRAVGEAVDALSQGVTEAFTQINDVIFAVRDFFGATFFGVEETANKTTEAVAATAAVSKEAADAAKKAYEELQKAIESGGKALDGIIKKSAEFGQAGFDAAYQFQQALADLQEQADSNELNAEQYARGVANATAEYERQIEAIKQVQEETKRAAAEAQKAAEEAAKKAEADQKRIEGLLNPNDAATKVQEDIAFVIEQQVKAEEELAAARAKSDSESANAAAARLAQLDGLRTKLEDQAQAIDQGFSEGFSAAFANTAESLNELVNKAAEFGNAGAEAAAQLQDGIAQAQEQVRDGIIPKQVYDQEVANQRRVFDERLAQIEEVRRQEQAARDAVFSQQVSANERVTAFLSQQTQAEIEAAEQVAARRQQAAFNVEAIEQRLLLERQALEAAREQGDRQASAAAVERINQLREALTVEQQIADGRRQQIADQQQLLSDQQAYQEQQLKAAEQFQQQQQQAQQQYAQQQAKIFEDQQKAAEAEAKRQEERIRGLNTLGEQTVTGTDVRTQEGAALVLNLAANAQDPAAIQARLQTKYLEQIALGISQAASNYFNSPVAIVGYSSFGG